MNRKLIGNNLKFLRKKAGMTQIEFAEKIGLTQAYVSKVESGEIAPSLNQFRLLALVFKISLDDLIGKNMK